MKITVELPDDLADHPNAGGEALEALAIAGYVSGTLTHYQASQILGLSRFSFDDLLTSRKIYHNAYSVEDLEEDINTLESLRAQGLLQR